MKYTDWNVEDIFKTKEDFDNAEKELEVFLKKIEEYKNKLSESAENLYECYELQCRIFEIEEKIYAYAMLKYHQNMSNSGNVKIYKKAQKIVTELASRIAFIEPEITKINNEKLEKFLNESENLREFKKVINDIMKEKEHILSEEGETILAKYSEIFSATEDIYNIFTETEFKFPSIKEKNGNELKMTHALYSKYMISNDIEIRKQAFKSMYSIYKSHINTITELYLARVKKVTITSKLRKYKSSLEQAVKQDDSSEKAYETLVNEVNKNINLNHEYIKLKSEMLKLDKLHMYDVYVNNLNLEENEVEYKEAQSMVLDALKPLGDEYVNELKVAFNNNWIDVYEKENKRTGAYSTGVYGVHPYILLDYINSSRDVSTIAHELGHAMHSYYSNKNQNIINSNYTIMVAEVASTVNEILLANYLIEKEKNISKKAALINEQLDTIRATLIRQTMFAEFEKIVHEKVEADEDLTSEDLNNIYIELVRKYFGEYAVADDEIKYEWARIPHFYSCFYVYKYSTGITAAIAIARKILSKEPGYVNKYINMLSQGGSKDSLELLRMVDVDLEKDETYEEAFKYFSENLEQLKKLVKEIGG